mmetsp:Transcript_54255/g.90038  ORF Transcript_54255/g.90038 Transcript_54255/m.90038 type:complete len:87 (+) Transcript_54255:87-347(+)
MLVLNASQGNSDDIHSADAATALTRNQAIACTRIESCMLQLSGIDWQRSRDNKPHQRPLQTNSRWVLQESTLTHSSSEMTRRASCI